MTPTDPKQDVRQQFEAWLLDTHLEANPAKSAETGRYLNAWIDDAWEGYQAALQSPAVRELVEALQGVIAVADRKTDEFDRAKAALAPFTALRTLGAGHVE